jgi:hypothetical protein
VEQEFTKFGDADHGRHGRAGKPIKVGRQPTALALGP